MRPAVSAGRAQRSPAVVEGRVAQLQQNLAELNSRKERYEKRLDSLERPTARDRVTALAHGGVKGAQKFFETKKNNNEKQIQHTLAKLDKMLQSAPPAIQDKLYQDTGRPRPAVNEAKPPLAVPQSEVAAPMAGQAPGPLAKQPKTKIAAKDLDAGGPPVEKQAAQEAANPHAHQSVQNALQEEVQHANHPHENDHHEHLKPTVQDILKKGGADHPATSPGPKAGDGSLRASWRSGAKPAAAKTGGGTQVLHN